MSTRHAGRCHLTNMRLALLLLGSLQTILQTYLYARHNLHVKNIRSIAPPQLNIYFLVLLAMSSLLKLYYVTYVFIFINIRQNFTTEIKPAFMARAAEDHYIT